MTGESKTLIATVISIGGAALSAVGGFLGWKFKKDAQRAADRESNERFLEQLDCRIDRAVDRRFDDYINNGEGA